MNSKGALELSMNTIIIIVIGVVLLSLGLMFVRGIFSQTTDLSDKVFANADKELDSLGGSVSSELIASPRIVRLKAGQTSGFVVLVTNLESGKTYSGLKGNLRTRPEGQGVVCEFTDGTKQINIRDLIPGAEDRIQVVVRSQKGSIGTKHCIFELTGFTENIAYDPVLEVQVVVS